MVKKKKKVLCVMDRSNENPEPILTVVSALRGHLSLCLASQPILSSQRSSKKNEQK